jgi:Na+-driven multidrug efflux pump
VRIVFAGTTFLFLIETFGACFRGSGDTKTPMKVLLIGLGLHIVLDPLLIFGIGPFPRMETTGAALATFLSQGIGAVIYIFLIIKGKLRFKFSLLPKFNLNFSIRLPPLLGPRPSPLWASAIVWSRSPF